MKAYITNLAYELPEKVEENESKRIIKATGVERRHICAENETGSDLAVRAAEKIFSKNENLRKKIDYVIFCTQAPDYFMPSTVCTIQDRLHLNKNIGAFDFNLGCSGFIYGLGIAKGFIESNQAQCILLLAAETLSKFINPKDHSTRTILGDAASAIIIEAKDDDKSGIIGMTYGTDGSGASELIIPVGGMRHRFETTPLEEIEDKYGNIRTNRNLYMNGLAIMDFALEVVPDCLQKIFQKTGLKKSDIDYYVFHQANRLILEYLQKKCDLSDLPYWKDVKNYGNTGPNSIPIALTDLMSQNKNLNLKRVMVIGFGVGLSWGGCVINLTKINK